MKDFQIVHAWWVCWTGFQGLAEERNVGQQGEDEKDGIFYVDLVEADVAEEPDTENGCVDERREELKDRPDEGNDLSEESKAAKGSVLAEAEPEVVEQAL